jgi:glyoxylase-like metal-dependent hydrolase (beta-lactamase superfamily II)
MTEYQLADPRIEVSHARQVARDVVVIENRDVDLVPNVGIIAGADAVLVVDTGMGIDNAAAVLTYATDYAKGRRLYLTTTHFHPEHAFGAQVFAGRATYLLNSAQAGDLAAKFDGYLVMFRGLSPVIADRLQGVHAFEPDETYEHERVLELGGRAVRLIATGRGHTPGDQVVLIPDAGILFTGDLVETGQFPIFPFFPPHDVDVSGAGWIDVLERLIALAPRLVVPGHGALGDVSLLRTVRDAIIELRDTTASGLAAAATGDALVERVTATVVAEHPEWRGREWISTAVASFAAAAAPAPGNG